MQERAERIAAAHAYRMKLACKSKGGASIPGDPNIVRCLHTFEQLSDDGLGKLLAGATVPRMPVGGAVLEQDS